MKMAVQRTKITVRKSRQISVFPLYTDYVFIKVIVWTESFYFLINCLDIDESWQECLNSKNAVNDTQIEAIFVER